jgi:hypothetical protein
MHELLGVDILQPSHYLLPYLYNCLHVELPAALLEEILKRWAQKIHHHDVILLILAVIVESWQAEVGRCNTLVEVCKQFGLIFKLVVLGLNGFQLHRYHLLRVTVDGVVDLSE